MSRARSPEEKRRKLERKAERERVRDARRRLNANEPQSFVDLYSGSPATQAFLNDKLKATLSRPIGYADLELRVLALMQGAVNVVDAGKPTHEGDESDGSGS